MKNHKTVNEISTEWDVTPRYVQYLCRTGKIDGAIKRAGSWFIPADAPNCLTNTKADAKKFQFAGTKGRIFKSAIKLIVHNGFDSVSLRDIAGDIGIQPSTIYNHFKSKQEILDTIYDFFCYHYSENRLSMNDMVHLLQNGTLMDVFEAIRYDFMEDCVQEMSDITKIIFHRIGMDERAREIGKTLMIDEGITYVEDIFESGIKSGRFAPFDTHAMAVFINSIRIYTLFCWIIDDSPDSSKKTTHDEHNLYMLAANQIKDWKPSPEEA